MDPRLHASGRSKEVAPARFALSAPLVADHRPLFLLLLLILAILTYPTSATAQTRADLARLCENEDGRMQLFAKVKSETMADAITLRDAIAQAEGQSQQPGAEPVFLDDIIEQTVIDQCGFSISSDGDLSPGLSYNSMLSDPVWNIFHRIGCSAKWNQDCEFTKLILPPDPMPGNMAWQICKLSYSIAVEKERETFNFKPAEFLPDQPGRTGRHKGFILYMRANGSHKVWDRWGSSIVLTDVKAQLVPADLSDSLRKARGCDIAKTPPPPQQVQPPDPSKPSRPAKISRTESPDHRFFRFALYNPGDVVTAMACRVTLYDTFMQQTIVKFLQERIEVPPRATWASPDMQNNNNTGWNLECIHKAT